MDAYISLISYRDENGQVQRKEGIGSYKECIAALAEFEDKNVISAEISRIRATVVVKDR